MGLEFIRISFLRFRGSFGLFVGEEMSVGFCSFVEGVLRVSSWVLA